MAVRFFRLSSRERVVEFSKVVPFGVLVPLFADEDRPFFPSCTARRRFGIPRPSEDAFLKREPPPSGSTINHEVFFFARDAQPLSVTGVIAPEALGPSFPSVPRRASVSPNSTFATMAAAIY